MRFRKLGIVFGLGLMCGIMACEEGGKTLPAKPGDSQEEPGAQPAQPTATTPSPTDGSPGPGKTESADTGKTDKPAEAEQPKHKVLQVASSPAASHACAVLDDKTAACWGAGEKGQLGNGANANQNRAVPVSNLTTVKAVAVGDAHSCALLEDGTAQCWGFNADGALGNSATADSNVPVVVTGLTGATALALGSRFSCAIIGPAGTIQCWGYGKDGRVGDSKNKNQLTPVAVAGILGATSIVAGGGHACVVLNNKDKTAKCWGLNDKGQLGDRGTTFNATPVTVLENKRFALANIPLKNIDAIVAGAGFTCAVLGAPASKVVCWGDNSAQQIQVGTTASPAPKVVPIPTEIKLTPAATSIAAGAYFFCAILNNKALSCTGDKQFGQQGDGSVTNSTALALGSQTSYFLLDDGTVKAVGLNNVGQVGNGEFKNTKNASGQLEGQTTPALVLGF